MRLHPVAATVLGASLSFGGILGVHVLFTHERKDDPVARVVDAFVPGLKIGARIADLPSMTTAITDLKYVPDVGYLGVPDRLNWALPDRSTLEIVQVRLLLNAHTRTNRQANPARSRIDAVELISVDSTAPRRLSSALSTWFGGPPRVGCSRVPEDDRLRQVQLWLTTPDGPDGVAMIAELPRDPEPRPFRPMVTSLVAFRGKFQGSRTLRANFTDSTCAQIVSSSPSR
jgi:hypothetical protein